jgi:hypothetical protein
MVFEHEDPHRLDASLLAPTLITDLLITDYFPPRPVVFTQISCGFPLDLEGAWSQA